MAPRMRTSQRINTAVFVPKMRAWLAVGGRTEDDKMARWQDRKMVEVRRANQVPVGVEARASSKASAAARGQTDRAGRAYS